jgi:hypothetical protein
MLKAHLKNSPKSINCDFEKAAINAAQKTYRSITIQGCFFHLSQNLIKRVIKNCHASQWIKPNFTLAFKRLQSLAFLPEKFVIVASFVCITKYFESNYIGKLKKGSKTCRVVPRFTISFWNLNSRVIKGYREPIIPERILIL